MTDLLDGNAAAGALGKVLTPNVTVAITTCAACGDARPVGELHAYLRAPGLVLRGASCQAVQIRVVRAPRRAWLGSTTGHRAAGPRPAAVRMMPGALHGQRTGRCGEKTRRRRPSARPRRVLRRSAADRARYGRRTDLARRVDEHRARSRLSSDRRRVSLDLRDGADHRRSGACAGRPSRQRAARMITLVTA